MKGEGTCGRDVACGGKRSRYLTSFNSKAVISAV